MENKKVELEIKLKNVQTVAELEQYLKDINKELKGVDINSSAFKDLSDVARKADNELKNIKEDLKGISDSKQLDSTAKLGGALAGAFATASVAASAFGESSNEAVQKAIATGMQLSVVLQSIKAITEGLESGNRKAFGEFVKGFKSSAIGAKLFGNTAKAAIAGTGIGILLVALGLLVANWDLVKEKVLAFVETVPFLNTAKVVIEQIAERVGSLGNLMNAVGSYIKAVFTSGADAAKAFNDELARGKAVIALEEQLELVDAQNKERERAIKILEAIGGKEKEISVLKKAALESELKILQDLKKSGETLTDDQKERIRDLQTELVLLEKRNEKLYKDNSKKKFFAEADAYNKATEKAFQNEEERVKENTDIRLKATDELLEQFKENKKEEVQFEIDVEKEKYDAVEFSETEKSVIRERIRRKEEKAAEDARVSERDATISFLKEKKDRTEEEEQILADLRLQKFQENVMPYIQAFQQTFAGVADVLNQVWQNQIDNISIQLETLDARFIESVENRKALESQLADSQGAAREQILAGIEAERREQNRLASERKKLENQKIKAQNKINEANWFNSIISTIANTAQAVTSALTIPPPLGQILSVVNSALGAAQLGIIGSNKPKPIPGFAKGGYTGNGIGIIDDSGHEVAGFVHAKEYVVNSDVLHSPLGSQLVRVLDDMKLKGFAEGGYTSEVPNILPNTSSALTAEAIAAALANTPIYTSWVEAREVGQRVEQIEERASI